MSQPPILEPAIQILAGNNVRNPTDKLFRERRTKEAHAEDEGVGAFVLSLKRRKKKHPNPRNKKNRMDPC